MYDMHEASQVSLGHPKKVALSGKPSSHLHIGIDNLVPGMHSPITHLCPCGQGPIDKIIS